MICKWFKKRKKKLNIPPFEESRQKAPWMQIAYQELGVAEVPGRRHNQRIIEYGRHITLDYDRDEIPWCSAFVNFCMDNFADTAQSGLARSWIKFGHNVPIEKAYEGCIAVFKRGNSSWQGHVAFLISMDDKYATVLGGNQGDKVSIAKYPLSKLIGLRSPHKV